MKFKEWIKPKFRLFDWVVLVLILGVIFLILAFPCCNTRPHAGWVVVRGILSKIQSGTDLYYDEHGGSYKGLCDVVSTTELEEIQLAQQQYFKMDTRSKDNFVCHDSDNAYAISIRTEESPRTFFRVFKINKEIVQPVFRCVDSTGVATTTTQKIEGNSTQCPR